MSRKTGLCFAVAAALTLAMGMDAQAFWGSRGSSGSCGSSGGGWGSGGSWGGSNGSSGSHGGFLGRIFHRGSNGSCGSSGGSYGSSGSHGSNGGYANYGGGGYYTSTARSTSYVVTNEAPAVKTQLTLKVPADAKVTLAGVATKKTGEVREFATSRLADGQAWQNYQVVVEMNRDGKMVREERTITLMGGQSQELSFGPAATTVARLTP